MKVLIADPDWRFAKQANDVLESLANLVVCKTGLEQALEQAEHWQPDLVLLDADLANQGLLERLAAMEQRPAILLTGWMDRYDQVWRAWQKGGDELLMKPVFRSRDLLEAVILARENAAAGTRPFHIPAASA